MLAINLAIRFRSLVERVVTLGSGPRVTMLQKVLNFEQMLAIENDPGFFDGHYDSQPERGLALARMIAHKTFVCVETLESRARPVISSLNNGSRTTSVSHPVESYMLHQGRKFVQRFDANAYLRILRMWQDIDLAEDAGVPSLEEAFSRCRGQKHLVCSIDTDACFPPFEQEYLSSLLDSGGADVEFLRVESEKGHDAFLVESQLFKGCIERFLKGGSVAEAAGEGVCEPQICGGITL